MVTIEKSHFNIGVAAAISVLIFIAAGAWALAYKVSSIDSKISYIIPVIEMVRTLEKQVAILNNIHDIH